MSADRLCILDIFTDDGDRSNHWDVDGEKNSGVFFFTICFAGFLPPDISSCSWSSYNAELVYFAVPYVVPYLVPYLVPYVGAGSCHDCPCTAVRRGHEPL